ncbi:sodium-dependent nutrient amino acid transporter 1 [Drosophila tropicalis]|uniref:sodium-dependent nutrient amino acid transporter 1 n=1 Tax=Drosophila tropicalis TaxID=46794 RepID=UPI0035ABE184
MVNHLNADNNPNGKLLPGNSETKMATGNGSSVQILLEGAKSRPPSSSDLPELMTQNQKPRDNWGSSLEFLMSCIALSVGLGNVWRFPFTALENGGGAFLVPYLVVLFLVGKPIYYMEMLLGQFSSRGVVGVFDFSPLMRGVGYAQLFALGVLATYYASVMALTLRYFFDSFAIELPWSYCRPEWLSEGCVNASSSVDALSDLAKEPSNITLTTSTKFYLERMVLNETKSLDNGIGYPNGNLALMLAISWLTVTLVIIRGVKSSGKASYVLALFPYVIMFVLLIRALTLPGAMDGVIYFLTPQWNKILEPNVWYNAVTQVFFSLAVCFGVIIMYSSYNRFNHNIYRDANIVTTLDTFTSMLSGIIIFGILGNLAHESGAKDIKSMVQTISPGPGLAFISYPEAIAKFKWMPQIFSLLFFAMLFMLGVGSNVGMVSCIMSVIKDKFVNAKIWLIVVGLSLIGYSVGLIYTTPGGQYLLTLIDCHAVTFVSLVSAIFELIAVGWVYGTKRLCEDAEFMLNIKTSYYYRICWSIVTPLVMIVIFVYNLYSMPTLKYHDQEFSAVYRVIGWCITAVILGQLIYWACYANYKQSKGSLLTRLRESAKPLADWGPLDSKKLIDYQMYRRNRKDLAPRPNGIWQKITDRIFG